MCEVQTVVGFLWCHGWRLRQILLAMYEASWGYHPGTTWDSLSDTGAKLVTLLGFCHQLWDESSKYYPALNLSYQLMAEVTCSAMWIFYRLCDAGPVFSKRNCAAWKNNIKSNEHMERIIISPSFYIIAMTCYVSCWQCQISNGKVETRKAHFSIDTFEKEYFLLDRCPTRLEQGSDQWDCFQEHTSEFFGSRY